MTGTLELQWDPEPADWADGLRATVPMYRFAPVFAVVFGLVGVIVGVSSSPWAGAFGLGCAVVIALFPLLAVRAAFNRNPVAATTVTAKVDEQSLRMMTIDGTAYSELDWSSLAGWLETRRGFILRTGTGRASPFYPVPHRAFVKPEQRQHFQDMLSRRLGQN